MYNIKRFTSKDFEELNKIIDCMEKNSSNYLVFKEQRLKYINKLISKTNNFLIHHFVRLFSMMSLFHNWPIISITWIIVV